MTTKTTHETEITLDTDVPLVRIVREFDAPPDKVFRAHADPELFARWNGPRGMETRIDHHDCRTGGSWRYVMSQDGEDYAFRGCFHTVRDDRLVQTFTFEGIPDSVALESMWFEVLEDGRTRLHTQSLFDSYEARDGMLSSGMDVGVNDGYARLDGLLASGDV
jgi:uncharacterized protein YndB with AHSA1/START domain